jgi:phosphoglycolate phosphatase/pyrophosphatase PpaX
MRQLRPELRPMGLENWWLKNFNPGIMEFLQGELGMSDDELGQEYRIWRSYNERIIPKFFPGFRNLILKYKARDGIVAVVSHSESDIIRRHYLQNGIGKDLLPDVIFGWDMDADKRKPSPYPVLKILDKFNLHISEALIVDDLNTGVIMSKATGVAVVAAGWAHRIPEIQTYMRKHCMAYFQGVEELGNFLMS